MSTISLIPQVVDLRLYCGDRAAIKITATDDTGSVDLSAGQLLAQIKAGRDDNQPTATFDVAVNPDGSALLSLTSSVTSLLGDFRGVWDCQWTPTGGDPVTIVQGKVQAYLDVSR